MASRGPSVIAELLVIRNFKRAECEEKVLRWRFQVDRVRLMFLSLSGRERAMYSTVADGLE